MKIEIKHKLWNLFFEEDAFFLPKRPARASVWLLGTCWWEEHDVLTKRMHIRPSENQFEKMMLHTGCTNPTLNLATFFILVGIMGSMNCIMSFVVECKGDPKRRLSGLSSEALDAFETVYDGLVWSPDWRTPCVWGMCPLLWSICEDWKKKLGLFCELCDHDEFDNHSSFMNGWCIYLVTKKLMRWTLGTPELQCFQWALEWHGSFYGMGHRTQC